MGQILRGDEAPDATEEALDLWANGTTGDDDKDGLSQANAVATLQKVFSLIPDFVNHQVIVHLRGTFTDPGNFTVTAGQLRANILISGGPDKTLIAGPWTADLSSITSIGWTGLALTPDQYWGYWIEILDGPAAGEVRGIKSHTANDFTINGAFSVDPGNAQFRIIRPTTTISGTGAGWTHVLGFLHSGFNSVRVQGLYFTGNDMQLYSGSTNAALFFANCIFDTTFAYPIWLVGAVTGIDNIWLDDSYVVDPLIACGLSLRGAGSILTIEDTTLYSVFRSNIRDLNVRRCKIANWILYHTRVRGRVLAQNVQDDQSYFLMTGTTIEDGTGDGVIVRDSEIGCQGTSVIVQNHGAHGINLENSIFRALGAIGGAGNVGAGVYAHDRSQFQFPDGTPPTITGAVGDFSTDGATEASTWAALDAGTPVVDVNEMTIGKEVA
jgi:hypothetical protein